MQAVFTGKLATGLRCPPPNHGLGCVRTTISGRRKWERRWEVRRHLCVQAAAPAARAPGKQQMLVFVPSHPLVGHWLAVARNKLSPPPIFRSAVAELGRVLIYEAASDWLPTVSGQVETPCGTADCTFVDPTQPIKVIPVLRAGLVLLDQALTVLPASQTFHVGYVRDETTLEASEYLNKLPQRFSPDDRILVADCMLATGGTIGKLLADVVERGGRPENIRIVAAVVAAPALKVLSPLYPGMRIYAGMIDETVNERGFIVPGLGDVGDRAFGT